MSRIPLKSAMSGVAHIVVNTVLQFVLVPVFIARLGLSTYGVYALIMAVGNLGTFTNFGFNTSLIKYLVEQPERSRSNQDIWVTATIMGGATLTAVATLLLGTDDVLRVLLPLDVEVHNSGVRQFFVAGVITGGMQVIAQIPSAVLDAQQKVYLTNGTQLIGGVLTKGGILLSLVVAPSLPTVGWITLGGAVLTTVSLLILARWTWGSMACDSLLKSFRTVAHKHFRYGRSIYAGSIMYFLYEPLTKVLISRFIGIAEVGFFDIAVRIKGMVWSIMERLLYPIMPLLAKKSNDADIRKVIEEVQQKLLLLLVPMIIANFFLSGPVIAVWLGASFPLVETGAVLIVTAYVVALLFVPLYQFLAIKGHPEKTLVLQSTNVVVNVILFIVLVPAFGYVGAIVAFSATVLVSTALCGWYQWKILHSVPVHQTGLVIKLAKLALSLLSTNIVVIVLPLPDVARLTTLAVVNTALTLLFWRWYRLISAQDVERYVPGHGRLARFLERLLVRSSP